MQTRTVLLAALLSSLSQAQIIVDGMPATILFTPYKLAKCVMSNDIQDKQVPQPFAVTSGHCYTADYDFKSFLAGTNYIEGDVDTRGTPCAMSVYPLADCKDGSDQSYPNVGIDANVTVACGGDELSHIGGVGRSFRLACGP